MVAVPRSKGCVTCRKRRVKCDEAKPYCTRCARAGYICSGYDRAVVFRNLSSAPFAATSRDLTVPSRPPPEDLPLPPSLPLTAFKSDICYAYLFQNFVWRTYGTPWLEMAAHGRLDPLSLETTHALALAYFAKDHRQSDIAVEGDRCYGRAVQQLIGALSTNPQEGLLVPVLVLLLYSSACGDKIGSISHVKGLMVLLQSCGPAAFADPVLASALESARATLVTISLITRKGIFLDQPEWRAGPWGEQPKSNQTRLMDILVVVPRLLRDLSKVGRKKSSVTFCNLLFRAMEQLEALFRWRWEWEVQHAADVQRMPRTDDAAKGVFADELHFANLGQVTDIMLYNAVLLWLLGVLQKLHPVGLDVFMRDVATRAQQTAAGFSVGCLSADSALQRPSETITLRNAAVEICRCIEYHIKHIQQAHDSSLFYLFPIGMAWNILKDDPEADYKGWIQDTLSSSPVTKVYFEEGYQWLWKLQTDSFLQYAG